MEDVQLRLCLPCALAAEARQFNTLQRALPPALRVVQHWHHPRLGALRRVARADIRQA